MVGFQSNPEIEAKNEILKQQTLFQLYDFFDGAFTYAELEKMSAERMNALISAKKKNDTENKTAKEEKAFRKEFGIRR